MFSIGPYQMTSRSLLAPMAGVTDWPFRQACLAAGAGLAVGEMLTSDTSLWQSHKTRSRLESRPQSAPVSMQIAGAVPAAMAQAAQACVEAGAQIVDINMGCPAKKVCNKAAGSALLRDELLVGQILDAVVAAVPVPVTLKIRTGWCPTSINALRIGQLAQDCGIQALSIHGRTRACRFEGQAEYHTIAQVAAALQIPVVANGDITSAEQAQAVLRNTGAAAVMIGRGALGNPWLFQAVQSQLEATQIQRPCRNAILRQVITHLEGIYSLYGTDAGVRIARKHFGWYLQAQMAMEAQKFRSVFNALTTPQEQLNVAQEVFGYGEPLEDQAA